MAKWYNTITINGASKLIETEELGNIFRRNEMTVYKVTFPAVVRVGADNIEEAKQKGLDRANWNFFTSWDKEDILNIETTTEYKICPQCKFYVAPINRDVCYECKSG